MMWHHCIGITEMAQSVEILAYGRIINIINTVIADDLAMQGSRASVDLEGHPPTKIISNMIFYHNIVWEA